MEKTFEKEEGSIELLKELENYLEEFAESDNEKKNNSEVILSKNSPIGYEEKKEEVIQQNLFLDNNIVSNNSESDVESDEDEFIQVNITNFDNLEMDTLSKPKHLYDCILGLRSENKERMETSLKSLPFLIRRNLEDLEVLSLDLIDILLKINVEMEFEEPRKKAIVALIIIQPEKISK